MNNVDSIFHAEQALRGDLDGWINDHTEQEGDCMIWQGGYSNSGKTPSMVLPRALPAQPGKRARRTSVNKVVWEQFHGRATPDGWVVWNSCGDSRCVNPLHLRCTTRKQMVKAQTVQGRYRRDEAFTAKIRTMSQARSVLDWETVTAIRAELEGVTRVRRVPGIPGTDAVGRLQTMKALAEKHGVSFSAIKRIIHWETWKTPAKSSDPFAQMLRLAA